MSSLWDVEVALASALTADSALQTDLGGDKVFSGRAPTGTVEPYIIIDSTTENDQSFFAAPGSNSTIDLHIWSAIIGHEQVTRLYRHLVRILHNKVLGLQAGTMLTGTIQLVMNIVDDSTEKEYQHLVARYTVLALS